jgi:hypothetical protein
VGKTYFLVCLGISDVFKIQTKYSEELRNLFLAQALHLPKGSRAFDVEFFRHPTCMLLHLRQLRDVRPLAAANSQTLERLIY